MRNDLGAVAPGTPIVVGNQMIVMPEIALGDHVIPVQATGELLVVAVDDYEIAWRAVQRAHEAFRAMSQVTDEQISQFFRTFADQLGDDGLWASIEDVNQEDVERARNAGRSTTRLVATEKMREAMIDGLLGWAKAPSRR